MCISYVLEHLYTYCVYIKRFCMCKWAYLVFLSIYSVSIYERFRSHQRSLGLIGCCKIKSDRGISVVISLVWMHSLAAGIGVGVRSMPTESFGRGGLILQDPKPPVNSKEISLMTHPDASMKMYDMNMMDVLMLILVVGEWGLDRISSLSSNNFIYIYCRVVVTLVTWHQLMWHRLLLLMADSFGHGISLSCRHSVFVRVSVQRVETSLVQKRL